MAGIFNGPARGGTRGGRDQFDWQDVKAAPDREYYLGHSVKALTGRWQKGKDVFWYTRDVQRGDAEAVRKREMELVKSREEELMMEALGLKPKKTYKQKQQLDMEDMRKLVGRGDGMDVDQGSEQERGGLGYSTAAPVRGSGIDASAKEMLDGVGTGGDAGVTIDREERGGKRVGEGRESRDLNRDGRERRRRHHRNDDSKRRSRRGSGGDEDRRRRGHGGDADENRRRRGHGGDADEDRRRRGHGGDADENRRRRDSGRSKRRRERSRSRTRKV